MAVKRWTFLLITGEGDISSREMFYCQHQALQVIISEQIFRDSTHSACIICNVVHLYNEEPLSLNPKSSALCSLCCVKGTIGEELINLHVCLV